MASDPKIVRRAATRIAIRGIEIDPLSIDQATDVTLRWLKSEWEQCRVVVTPNLDHLVLLTQNPVLKQAYDAAALVIVDGMPLVWLSKVIGARLPQRISGPSYVYAVLEAISHEMGLRVCLMGGGPGVSQRAAETICRMSQTLTVHAITPSQGFSHLHPSNASIVEEINAFAPDLLIVGLGAPKQEVWAFELSSRLNAKVVICAGSTLDMLAGTQKRAPLWMQNSGLEFLFRLIQEPRRLWRRYLIDLIYLPRFLIEAATHRE